MLTVITRSLLSPVVVIGASAGGVEALCALVAGLPRGLRASVVVVLHLAPFSRSNLPAILARAGRLPAKHVEEGDALEPGRVHVAPPDHHVLVERDHLRLTRGPRVNGHRPAIDVLFRSAARSCRSQVIAVVLSGTLDDGVHGLEVVRRRGGLGVVQDPEDAAFPDLPANALASAGADRVAPLAELPGLLVELAEERARSQPSVEADMARRTHPRGGRSAEEEKRSGREARVEGRAAAGAADGPRDGTPSGYSCPDCGGVLWEVPGEGKTGSPRFRCRVGHGYDAESLLASDGNAVEDALWTALRALEERASLSERLFLRAESRNQTLSAARFAEQTREAQARIEVLRNLLGRGEPVEAALDLEEAE
jgi:two-component system chemotaxis response regulator CheB